MRVRLPVARLSSVGLYARIVGGAGVISWGCEYKGENVLGKGASRRSCPKNVIVELL